MATDEEKIVEDEELWDGKAEGTMDIDSYGTLEYTFHSDEAFTEHESYFYLLLETTEEQGIELEMSKEQGIELLKAMAKGLGAKKMRIEVEF